VSLLASSWHSPRRPGFRRRFAPGAPANGSERARPLTFRSGPSAARRLLQPPQPASTPARSPDPRLAQPGRALARSARRPRFREARKPHRHARPRPRVMMTVPAPRSGGGVHRTLPVEPSRARSALVRGSPLFGRRPCGRREESFFPTRSARAPLVMKPRLAVWRVRQDRERTRSGPLLRRFHPGPRRPRLREEERGTPHPRSLPSARRLAVYGAGGGPCAFDRGHEQSRSNAHGRRGQ